MRKSCVILWLGVWCLELPANTFVIDAPGGDLEVEVPHVAPAGALVRPASPELPAFRPPSIFSAPLPSGSGARALGSAGAFTALADDATAASWNPAGLIQLERPEVSIALRGSRTSNRQGDGASRVGDEEFSEDGVNYASVVYPFAVGGQNLVVSLNLQETFDFTQQYSARTSDRRRDQASDRDEAVYRETRVDSIEDGVFDVDITSQITTRKVSAYEQELVSSLVNDLSYDQSGVLYAFSPALAAEITPTFSLGAAVNFHMDQPGASYGMRSSTRVRYGGRSVSTVSTRETVTTSGSYTYQGTVTFPPSGSIPFPIRINIADEGTYPAFTDEKRGTRRDEVVVAGDYNEVNELDDIQGVNATIGALWAVNQRLSLGASLETPWSADAVQTKTIAQDETTYNRDRSQVLDRVSRRDVTTRDVQFDFPMSWTVGGLYRWTELFYTMVDVGWTEWSDFAFEADGDEKINPLDGQPHASSKATDTWQARFGLEYLVDMTRWEIPLRGGFAWEERPALDEPDEVYSVSCGSGIGWGKGHQRRFIDVAYTYAWSRGSSGLLPEGGSDGVDTEEHQVMISMIWHL